MLLRYRGDLVNDNSLKFHRASFRDFARLQPRLLKLLRHKSKLGKPTQHQPPLTHQAGTK